MQIKNIEEISRIELAKKIRDLFISNRNTQKYEKIDDNFLVNYYFDCYDKGRNPNGIKIDDFDLKIFEEDYKLHLENEKKLLEETGLNTDEIKNIVSAFSHSEGEKSILEDLPVEKDLRIFPNVETLYLLYTRETESKFLKYKENSRYKNRVKIEGILIDTSIETVYREVINLILEGKISKNNTVLDTTLGFKEIGIVFYKISVEKQIKSINWRETMLSNYKPVDDKKNMFKIEKGQGPRMSLITKLNLMKEPLEESNRIYRKINENIIKANCKTVSDLYEVVGIEDLKFFYNEIGKIFNFFKMIEYLEDIEKFYDDLNETLIRIFKYKFLPENISRLREYIKYLLKIMYVVKEDNLNWLKFSRNIFEITENEIKYDEDRKRSIIEDRRLKKLKQKENLKDIEIDEEKIKKDVEKFNFFEDKDDELSENEIDDIDYFCYLLIKQTIFEKIPSKYLRNVLKEHYDKEKVKKIITIISEDKIESEKIFGIKKIIFEIEDNDENYLKSFKIMQLEEVEISSLADKNIGILKYKNGLISIPFEIEGKLETIKINFMEETFVRKKDTRETFKISDENDMTKLKKKIRNGFDLEKFLNEKMRKFPIEISNESEIKSIEEKEGEKIIVVKSDRKTKLRKILFDNSDTIVNKPIVELFNNIEKNKFEISKKDMENKFKIKDQNIKKVKDIIDKINELIRIKMEEKISGENIENFIIYENGLRINLKYR